MFEVSEIASREISEESTSSMDFPVDENVSRETILPKTRAQLLEERFEKLKPKQKVAFLNELENRRIRMDKKRANSKKRAKMQRASRRKNMH